MRWREWMERAGLALVLALGLAGGLRLLQGLLGARLLDGRFGWRVQGCALGDPFYDWLAVALLFGTGVALAAFFLRRARWLALLYAGGFGAAAWLLLGSLAHDCLGNTWSDGEILRLLAAQADLLLLAALGGALPAGLLRRWRLTHRAAAGAAGSGR